MRTRIWSATAAGIWYINRITRSTAINVKTCQQQEKELDYKKELSEARNEKYNPVSL